MSKRTSANGSIPQTTNGFPEFIDFVGPCPFLTCLIEYPHAHPVCPDCGAVRFGNMLCSTCRANRGDER